MDQEVKFLSHGPGYDLFLTATEAVLRVRKPRALRADNGNAAVPNSEFTQVAIRLPNTLTAGTYTVFIRAHTRISNTGTIRIAP